MIPPCSLIVEPRPEHTAGLLPKRFGRMGALAAPCLPSSLPRPPAAILQSAKMPAVTPSLPPSLLTDWSTPFVTAPRGSPTGRLPRADAGYVQAKTNSGDAHFLPGLHRKMAGFLHSVPHILHAISVTRNAFRGDPRSEEFPSETHGMRTARKRVSQPLPVAKYRPECPHTAGAQHNSPPLFD